MTSNQVVTGSSPAWGAIFVFMSIKYLVFDLDDTLLRSDNTISSYTIDVLNKAKEKGMHIVFNTSRSLQNSKKYADLIKPDFGIYNGGCLIVDKENRVLYSKTIPADRVKKLTKYFNSICKKISVQSEDTFYASDKEYKGQNAVWADFANGLEVNAYKIICFSMNHTLIEESANKYDLEYQNYLNGGWHRLSVKGANKFNGILKLISITSSSLEEFAAFGDDFGDMEMISKCGVGVAMKNSQKEVLEIAPNVTLSNDEDGCAHFIENNLL